MDLMISPRKICNDDHSMAKVLCKSHLETPHLEKTHLVTGRCVTGQSISARIGSYFEF